MTWEFPMRHTGSLARGHRRRRVTVAGVALGLLLGLTSTASAEILFGPRPSFRDTVVGQTTVAWLDISNLSSPPESIEFPIVRATNIDLIPSCTAPDVACSPESGVYALSSTGTGSSTPAGNPTCEGTWTIVADTGDPTTATRYRFVPPGGEGTLALAAGETCRVTFTTTTLRAPTTDVFPESGGVETYQLGVTTPVGVRPDGSTALLPAQGVSNVSSVELDPPPADLSVAKSCDLGPVAPGSVVNCSISVFNAGPSTAQTVSVNDDLPDGVRLLGTPSGTAFTCVGTDPFTCNLGELEPNTSATLSFSVRVDDVGPGETITNVVSVSAAVSDPDDRNNMATATTTVVSCTITGAGDITGTPGDDVICGSAGRDRISGLAGNDIIFGFGGDDDISGGTGNDVLHGGDGNDRLAGDGGDDRLLAGAGVTDRLAGGAGDDTLNTVDGFGGDYAAGMEHLRGDTCLVDPGDSVASCDP